jgi:hypothetical protein
MNISDVMNRKIKDTDKLDVRVKKALLSGPRTLVQLADKFELPPKAIESSVDRLREKGHNVSLQSDTITIEKSIQQGSRLVVDSKDFFDGKWHKFGICSDQHLYSKYARLDVLNAVYDIFEREGVTHVFNAGNAIDGECRFNKFDLVGRPGIGPQLEYFANEFPQRKGIVTSFITGDDHEGWYIQREGVNIGQLMQDTAEAAGREDLKWIGHVEADVVFKARKGQAWGKIMHPGGGTSYAISYTEQKIVESFQGGEKPKFLIIGHYHKFNHGYPREVHTVQAGTTQDQTIFMRKLKLQAHLGGIIVRFHQADTGEINRFDVEWFPFYDKGFYAGKDKYRQW